MQHHLASDTVTAGVTSLFLSIDFHNPILQGGLSLFVAIGSRLLIHGFDLYLAKKKRGKNNV